MKTACFDTYTGPGRICIARFAPRGTPGGYRYFKALAPGPWFNSVSRPKYERLYGAQLAALDPQRTRDELIVLAGGAEPVLLCWEKPPFTEKNWCHRRIVADWFARTLGEKVEELEPPARRPAVSSFEARLVAKGEDIRKRVGIALRDAATGQMRLKLEAALPKGALVEFVAPEAGR